MSKPRIIAGHEIEDDAIVLTKEDMEGSYVPAKKEDLPDSETILKQIEKIMEFMCKDELLQIRNKDRKSYESVVRDKFKSFYDRYPGIFDMIIKGQKLDMLMEMLKQIDLVKNNKITMTNAEDTLRDKLADEFIYPNLSKKQIKEIKKTIKKNKKNKKSK